MEVDPQIYICRKKTPTKPPHNWKLEYVWKHKSYLDSQIKNNGSIDFTLT